MAFVNYNNREITVKIVYYGPALSGKTTCLKYIYSDKSVSKKGKLITLDTDGDRTLFFDFLPIEVGKVGNYTIKIQLYTVPGQVAYNTTRRMVLQGSDGIVMVADSQKEMREQNIESLQNLIRNLKSNSISYSEIPIILQYNKRDLKDTLTIDELNEDLNRDNKSFFPTIATNGENVLEALHAVMKIVLIYLKNRLSIFQKDKTVMFTREAITSSTIKKEVEDESSDYYSDEATENEGKLDLFELGNADGEEAQAKVKEEQLPQLGKDEEEQDPEKSEDIFHLDDYDIERKEKSGIEIPDVDFPREMQKEKKTGEDLSKEGASESEQILELNESSEMVMEESRETFNIPLNVEIPKGKKEVKINLNIKLTVKR